MSATNRGGVRIASDVYLTTDADAARCVRSLGCLLEGAWVVEPSAGGGAFVRAAATAGAYVVTTVDVDPARGVDIAADWLTVTSGMLLDMGRHGRVMTGARPDAIIGNPPYSAAEAHVRHALALVRPSGVVAFLLRLAFLESKARSAFWREFPAVSVDVMVPRPSFTGDGRSDASAYAWFTWRPGNTRTPVLGWLP